MNKILSFFFFVCFISNFTYAQLPQAGIIPGNQHICPGTCTDYLNASTNATSYKWLFAGANPAISTDVNPINICYSTPGNYTVILIATNSFGSDTLTLNNYMTIYPLPPPMAIEYCGDTLFATMGFSGYQWYFNGMLINGATDFFYVTLQSGAYNVVGTDANGCEVEAVFWGWGGGCNCCSDIDNFELENSISVFPNPAAGTFTIKSNSSETLLLDILNSLGEIVYSANFSGRNEYQVDVMLSTGIYFVRVSDGERTVVRKLAAE
jgi:hypothetical protein